LQVAGGEGPFELFEEEATKQPTQPSKGGFTVAAECFRQFAPEPAHSVRAQKGFGGVASSSMGTGPAADRADGRLAQSLLVAIRRYRAVVAQTSMTKPQLNGPHIGPRFEQTDGEGVVTL